MGRTRLLALCWTGFLLLFFTFSTTQEYYSMPLYPALALLLGCAIDTEGRWVTIATKTLVVIAAVAALLIGAVLFAVRHAPTLGDISNALQQHPEVYTLSLATGRSTRSCSPIRAAPLVLAGLAFAAGAVGAGRRAAAPFSPWP